MDLQISNKKQNNNNETVNNTSNLTNNDIESINNTSNSPNNNNEIVNNITLKDEIITGEEFNTDIKSSEIPNNHIDISNLNFDLIENIDIEFINIEYINKRCDELMNLYNVNYNNYVNEIQSATKKYKNKSRYKYDLTNYITIFDTKLNKEVFRIKKIKILNTKEYLNNIKQKIQRTRVNLIVKYYDLLESKNVKEYQIKNFKNQKKKFIDKLNEYYSIHLYYNKLNNINSSQTIKLLKTNLINDRLFYESIYLNNEQKQDYINMEKMVRDQYIQALTSSDKNDMKTYLINKKKLVEYEELLLSKINNNINVLIIDNDLFEEKFIKFNKFKSKKFKKKI